MTVNSSLIDFSRYADSLSDSRLSRDIGKVTDVVGLLLKGFIPGAALGSLCQVFPLNNRKGFVAEVVGFQERSVLLMPLGDMAGVGLGSRIELKKSKAMLSMSDQCLGRILNAMGEPIDSLGPFTQTDEVPIYPREMNPLQRAPIDHSLGVGVRSIDSLITLGRGQRMGIMAGSGVGKSVLLGMMARQTEADINVIAMIGERGREVREFVEDILGPEGLKKSVIVCATSDQSPLMRMRGAFVASAIAESFAKKGAHVLLMMDSLTRFAMAQREIGLSTGEPPSTKGYTPSVYSLLPRLLERAGNFEQSGSVTGIYTVLIEGDDPDDPIGDAVRSIVDGHIWLDRKLAERGHFPAVDVLRSTSRVMRQIVPQTLHQSALKLRRHLSIYREAEELINIGAYQKGASAKIDEALSHIDWINQFLQQEVDDLSPIETSHGSLLDHFGGRN